MVVQVTHLALGHGRPTPDSCRPSISPPGTRVQGHTGYVASAKTGVAGVVAGVLSRGRDRRQRGEFQR